MAEPDSSPRRQPIIQPRLARLLKKRPKVVDKGVREEFWEKVEENQARRRMPDTAAERAVQSLFSRAGESAAPVARDRLMNRIEDANESVLEGV